MVPQKHRGVYRYETGHNTEGLIYRLKIRNSDNEEISRTPTGRYILWEGNSRPANFGIKQYKKAIRASNKKSQHELIEMFKKGAWNNQDMKAQIARSALKAVK